MNHVVLHQDGDYILIQGLNNPPSQIRPIDRSSEYLFYDNAVDRYLLNRYKPVFTPKPEDTFTAEFVRKEMKKLEYKSPFEPEPWDDPSHDQYQGPAQYILDQQEKATEEREMGRIRQRLRAWDPYTEIKGYEFERFGIPKPSDGARLYYVDKNKTWNPDTGNKRRPVNKWQTNPPDEEPAVIDAFTFIRAAGDPSNKYDKDLLNGLSPIDGSPVTPEALSDAWGFVRNSDHGTKQERIDLMNAIQTAHNSMKADKKNPPFDMAETRDTLKKDALKKLELWAETYLDGELKRAMVSGDVKQRGKKGVSKTAYSIIINERNGGSELLNILNMLDPTAWPRSYAELRKPTQANMGRRRRTEGQIGSHLSPLYNGQVSLRWVGEERYFFFLFNLHQGKKPKPKKNHPELMCIYKKSARSKPCGTPLREKKNPKGRYACRKCGAEYEMR